MTAPNGIRILQDLGVFDEVLAASGEKDAALPSHAFFDGAEGHALVCEVRCSLSYFFFLLNVHVVPG